MKKRLLSFIPYKHVIISTSLSLDEAVNLISDSISPAFNPILNPLPNSKKFQGEVSKQGFKIRVTDYYRSSLTYVVGKFIPHENSINIDMYIAPNPLFLLALPLLAVFGVCMLGNAIATRNYFQALASIFLMLFLGFGHFLETDTLDWFMGNLLEKHLEEL